jgi:hypothetical protein
MGVLRQPLKRYSTSGCVAQQTLQLITPMRRNIGIGMQGKAVHTGTARSRECRPFSFIAKARADAAHFRSSAFPKGNALCDRGRHGAGKLRFGVEQRIIARGHSSLNSHLQIFQPAQLTDDPVADLLEDLGNVGIARRLDFDKAGLEGCFGTIEVDALKEDDMKMDIQETLSTTPCRPP